MTAVGLGQGLGDPGLQARSAARVSAVSPDWRDDTRASLSRMKSLGTNRRRIRLGGTPACEEEIFPTKPAARTCRRRR